MLMYMYHVRYTIYNNLSMKHALMILPKNDPVVVSILYIKDSL